MLGVGSNISNVPERGRRVDLLVLPIRLQSSAQVSRTIHLALLHLKATTGATTLYHYSNYTTGSMGLLYSTTAPCTRCGSALKLVPPPPLSLLRRQSDVCQHHITSHHGLPFHCRSDPTLSPLPAFAPTAWPSQASCAGQCTVMRPWSTPFSPLCPRSLRHLLSYVHACRAAKGDDTCFTTW